MTFTLHADVISRLKQADPDRYRAALFAEEVVREKLILLYAFHVELAKVPELVSEPMIGQIRYQWWRDAIAEIYETDSVRSHEITTPLRRLLQECDVPRFWVDQLIDGRERDIDPRPFNDLTEVQDYCAATSGALMKMAVKICGVEIDDRIEPAGTAWGLTGLARAYGYYHETMLSEVSFERLCHSAKAKYESAKESNEKLSAESLPALAYASLVPRFLNKITHKGFDPKTDRVRYSPLAKQFHLLQSVIKGRI